MTLLAAALATVLFVAMAAFQASLAAGAPFGAHVLGGEHAGTLPPRLRVVSGFAAILLLVFAVVVLARAVAILPPAGLEAALMVGCWIVAGFLALNTLGNLASKSKIERTLFAGTTGLLTVLSGYVALTG